MRRLVDSRVWVAGPMMDTSVAIGIVALTSFTAACEQAPHPDSRLDDLEHRIQQEQARLSAVQHELADAEARAATARSEAEFQSCRAQLKEVRAEIERRRAECAKDVADLKLCEARNSEKTANSGLVGCGLGLAAAVLSGGSAAPWALGGCGVGLGAGESSSEACPATQCRATLQDIESAVLSARGLSSIPRCGGFAGLVVASRVEVAPRGVVVDRVVPGSFADSANIAAADILIEVNGTSVGTSEAIAETLALAREGQPLLVSVIRRGKLFRLTALASRRSGNGQLADTLKLGVDITPSEGLIEYDEGVTAAGLKPRVSVEAA